MGHFRLVAWFMMERYFFVCFLAGFPHFKTAETTGNSIDISTFGLKGTTSRRPQTVSQDKVWAGAGHYVMFVWSLEAAFLPREGSFLLASQDKGALICIRSQT